MMSRRVLVLPSFLLPWFVGGRIGSNIIELTSANFDTFVKKNNRVLVDFIEGSQDDELSLALRKLRGVGSTVPMAKVNVDMFPDLARRYVPDEHYPQLLWFLHGAPTGYHRSVRKADAIIEFAFALDRDPIADVESEGDVNKWNVVALVQTLEGSPLHKAAEIVASKYMATVAFAHVQNKADTVSWYVDAKAQDTFTGGANAAALEGWVETKLMVSEDVPESPVDSDGVTIVVGKTFDDIVFSEEKDVFLMIYAPWCGFCRKALPAWGEFARRVAGEQKLVVAKMDGTINKVGHLDFIASAYPDISYVHAGGRQALHYGGNRTVEAYMAFAIKHGITSLVNPNKEIEL